MVPDGPGSGRPGRRPVNPERRRAGDPRRCTGPSGGPRRPRGPTAVASTWSPSWRRSRRRSATIAQTWASARASLAADETSARPDSRWRSSAASNSGTPSPVAAVVIRTSGRLGRGRSDLAAVGVEPRRAGDQHRSQLCRGPLRARLVALVDHDQVGDLEQSGLDRLDLVAHLRGFQHDRRVGRCGDFDLALARPHRLDEDQVETSGGEDRRGRGRRRCEAACVPARCHRADEDGVIVRVSLHPDAIPQQGATGDRAGWIHGDHRDGPVCPTHLRDECGDEGRLARAGRAGDPDEVGSTGHRIEPAQCRLGDRAAVLDRGQQPRQRQPVSGDRGIGKRGGSIGDVRAHA